MLFLGPLPLIKFIIKHLRQSASSKCLAASLHLASKFGIFPDIWYYKGLQGPFYLQGHYKSQKGY